MAVLVPKVFQVLYMSVPGRFLSVPGKVDRIEQVDSFLCHTGWLVILEQFVLLPIIYRDAYVGMGMTFCHCVSEPRRSRQSSLDT